jgi:flagellar biosynthesis protein FlhA
MGQELFKQVFGQPRVLALTAAVLGIMGLVPGMPNLAFLLLAAVAGAAAWLQHSQRKEAARREESRAEQAEQQVQQPEEQRELEWEDVSRVDPVGLEVGYRLVPLVESQQGGELMARIKGVRKKLSQTLGFLIQPVHIRDNLELAPNQYRIMVFGVPVAEAEARPDRELAINPGGVTGGLRGQETRDPAFGMPALWIEPGSREHAQTLGYTVADASTVIATHLSQVLRKHAQELLGHQEVQQMLDVLAKQAPKLVEDLAPKTLPLATVVRVMQMLLAENVPVRNIRAICETLVETGARTQDPEALLSAVRARLGRQIVQELVGMRTELPVITLAPELEQLLQEMGQRGDSAALEPGLADRLQQALQSSAEQQEARGEPAVLLVPQQIRNMMARFVRQAAPGLQVLAHNEIPEDKRLRLVGSVSR